MLPSIQEQIGGEQIGGGTGDTADTLAIHALHTFPSCQVAGLNCLKIGVCLILVFSRSTVKVQIRASICDIATSIGKSEGYNKT